MLVSGFLGRRLNVSRLDETKIGVRPGGPAGNLGGVIDSPAGFSVVWIGFCLLRNCCSLAFCRSFSLALNGEGLLRLRFVTMDGAFSFDLVEVGLISAPLVEELRLGLMLAPRLLLKRLPDLPPVTEEDALEDPLDELLNVGLADGATDAGVAIRVGVISLLVMMATVVRVLERLLELGLLRVGLNRLGLITGVNVRLGLVNVKRDWGFLDDPLMELC